MSKSLEPIKEIIYVYLCKNYNVQPDNDGFFSCFADFAFSANNQHQGIPLVINELMASNSSTIPDPQGQYDDWIEIYNAGQTAINIGGMYLTDDLSIPTKWRFPSNNPSMTTIPSHGFLLIWADEDVTDSGLHTDFKLSTAGEDVGLYNIDCSTLIDSITFGEQAVDVSYGRYPDGSDTLLYMSTSTPGGANRSGFLGFVAEPKFSHKRGFYDAPFSVIIATQTSGAVIYYTLDGSEPYNSNRDLPAGIIYSGPIVISTTTCLRAAAFKTGWKPTNISTHTYIFLDHVIQQPALPPGYPNNWGHKGADYQMDPEIVNNSLYKNTVKDDLKSVPTLSLVMHRDDLFASGGRGIYIQGENVERAVSAELIFPDGSEGFQINCAVMIVGGTSPNRWKMDKLSMRLKFKSDYGPVSLKFPLFGEGSADEFNTLVVDAGMNNSWGYGGSLSIGGNRSWIQGRPVEQRDIAQYTRDQFVSDIQNTMGGLAPHGRYVHLYLNGLYWGLYLLHERPDEHFASAYLGGDPEDYDVLKHNSNTVINGSGDNYNEMFSITISGRQPDAQYQRIQQYLDVPSFIDYMLSNFYVGNTDWAHQNWYATRNRTDPAGRWRYHSWDAERIMEGLNDNVTGKNDDGGPTRLHRKLTDSAEYRMLFADHVHRHFFNNGILTPQGAAALYQVRLKEVNRAVVGESARWGDNQIDKFPCIRYTRDEHWVKERDWLLNEYFPVRTDIVLGQLRKAGLYPNIDAPVYNVNGVYQHGGQIWPADRLSMTAPAGAIYYTLDGTDPRLPGVLAANVSRVSPSAVRYTSSFTLTKSAHVKSRVLSGSTWSALNEATFAVGLVAQNLRVTEIMYHPKETNDPNEEFIELKNIGTETINLNLVRFTNGIDFTFPDIALAASQYTVAVKDRGVFIARYGSTVNIAGQYSGSLSDGGERIRLEDAIGQTILDFDYKDGWLDITDGGGLSLTIIDADNPDPNSWSQKESWRASLPSPGM